MLRTLAPADLNFHDHFQVRQFACHGSLQHITRQTKERQKILLGVRRPKLLPPVFETNSPSSKVVACKRCDFNDSKISCGWVSCWRIRACRQYRDLAHVSKTSHSVFNESSFIIVSSSLGANPKRPVYGTQF